MSEQKHPDYPTAKTTFMVYPPNQGTCDPVTIIIMGEKVTADKIYDVVAERFDIVMEQKEVMQK